MVGLGCANGRARALVVLALAWNLAIAVATGLVGESYASKSAVEEVALKEIAIYIFADRRSGARVRKEFAETKELSEKSRELLQQIISEAKVSGMTKEEFFEICGELYE